jgi:putative Holliday junction resolvase
MISPMTCLGFDYGQKRIGVSVGTQELGTARPLGTVANVNGTPDWQAIDALILEWRPALLVVGMPLTEDSKEQEMTRQARGFVRRLRKHCDCDVVTCDERFSSIEASAAIRAQRASGQRSKRSTHADVDATAAAIILERWFAEQAA